MAMQITMEPQAGLQIVKAHVPLAETFQYATILRSNVNVIATPVTYHFHGIIDATESEMTTTNLICLLAENACFAPVLDCKMPIEKN